MASSITDSQVKLNELLEGIRQEFNNVSQEANSYRLQNQKDFDYKINQNLAEMQQIRNTVYELELSHRKLKDSYQEEINRLKLELSQKDTQITSLSQQPEQKFTSEATEQQKESPPITTTFMATPQLTAPVVQPTTQTQSNGPTLAPLISALGSQLQQPATQENLPPLPQHPKDVSSSSTSAAASVTPVFAPVTTETKPVEDIKEVKKEEEQTTETKEKENYLVPFDQRANQLKSIPPFLLDLDSQQVPDHLKKQADDYYVLYNPALPRTLDVDLHASLDHSSVVCCVKFSNDGEYLATGCNKTTQVYRVSTGELVCKLSDDNANPSLNVTSSTADNDDSNGSNGSSGSTSASTNNATLSADLYIRSVCFSPDGKFLATGAEDRLIRIWDIAERKIIMVLQGHDQDVYSLDYFPSGDKLVSGSGDRTVRIWDLKTGQCSLTLSIEDGVTTVAVSPGDGKYIAAGSLDRAVRVWDSETGFLVERLDSENELGTGHKDSVYSVVFTRNGNKVVSGSLDRTVKLWDLRNDSSNNSTTNTSGKTTNGVCEVTYVGHKDFVLSVTTTVDDKYILSGSKDRGVLFWDNPSGNPLLMLQGHRNSVISVAVAKGTPLGDKYEVFATGSGDCRARIWKFSKATGELTENKIQEV